MGRIRADGLQCGAKCRPETDDALWAVKRHRRPDRLCIFGGSYGGYASLMGVVKEPDLYKCAIGYVGVYDLLLMKDTGNVAERLDWGLDYLDEALGDDPAKLKEISPHYHVDKIKASVFIVHGGRDEQAHYDNALNIRKEFERHNKPSSGCGKTLKATASQRQKTVWT